MNPDYVTASYANVQIYSDALQPHTTYPILYNLDSWALIVRR